ncbi:MAG: glycosyltransferase [Halobacteriota archaeon]
MNSKEESGVQNAERPPLRICFVTTYPPRFDGIAMYSHELIGAITQRGHSVSIICNPDRSVGGHADQENVFPVMNPEKVGWFRDVFNVIMKLDPDVVHIQHEYGLYDIDGKLSTDLLDLLIGLNLQQISTVMTYHSVYRTLSDKERLFMNISLQLIDVGVVHEELQKIFLPVNLGWVPQNVKVIAHGAEVIEAGGAPDQLEAKRKYGLEGKEVVMCLGWWERTSDLKTL